MSFSNPSDAQIRKLLTAARHIAVVGLSPQPARPSHEVARFMQQFGYHIIPVRPAVAAVLGEPAHARLQDVPGPIDLVNVFRAPAQVGPLVDACLELKLPVLWLQEGVVNEAEALRAQAAGIQVIMDRCIYKEYCRLLADGV